MEKKVLLVADDDEMNRAVIKRFLSTEYTVLEAGDGREAMEILHMTPVDGLLLDIIMPEMDGLQVLRLLGKTDSYPYLGVLVATSTKERTEREALSLGADDVVSKPYDPVVIDKRLKNVLAIKEIAREKALLGGGGTDAAALKKEHYAVCAGEVADKLDKIAEILAFSRENPQMILAMAADIHKETDRLRDALAEE